MPIPRGAELAARRWCGVGCKKREARITLPRSSGCLNGLQIFQFAGNPRVNADLDRALAFYVDVIGFQVLFDRTEERFVFLDLDGVHLMLEEAAGPGRRFRTAPLEYPYGRGVNF
jgi:hypothetical protein